MAAHDDARELLLQHLTAIGRSNTHWRPNALFTSLSQTDLLVPKQKAMQAEGVGVSAHGVARSREVLSQGGDPIGSEHALTAEPAGETSGAQTIGGSSDRAKGMGDPPHADDEHAASIQAAAAVAAFSPETAAAIVSASDTILSDVHALSPSVTASMPEQSSRPWHDAAQQERTHTEGTKTPAQSTGIIQLQSADKPFSAATPPFFASSDTARASTQTQAAPALQSQEGSAIARQHQGATVGADATTESAAELGQGTPGVPGLSAADVRQLMRLMQSMQAAATWPKGAPADQMTAEQRLPAKAAPAEQMTGEQGLPAETAPAEASEVTTLAYQMQACADSRQLQVG